MTSILPLVATVPLNSAAPSPAVTGEEASASFSDLLDPSVANKPAPPKRMFAFTELGMFGRHGTQFLPGSPNSDNAMAEPAEQAPAQLCNAPSTVQFSLDGEPVEKPARQPSGDPHDDNLRQRNCNIHLVSERNLTDMQAQHLPSFNSGNGAVPRITVMRNPPHMASPPAVPDMRNAEPKLEASTPAEPFSTISEPGLQTVPEEALLTDKPTAALSPSEQIFARSDAVRLEGAGRPVRPSLPTPPNRAANPVNLVVSGSDGALTIAARAQGETAEETLKLRQLVEDTAAEFGLEISEFRLNGALAENPFVSTTGGNHGSRTR